MTSTHTIEYIEKRCFDCGTFWAIESSQTSLKDRCPRCAGKKLSEAYDLSAQYERSMNAMRGALTKAKKGKS